MESKSRPSVVPSLREVWDDAAVFVDPDDTPGLTQALRDLTADATQLSALARMAHALVTKEFTA
jgi:glycogen synthase